MLLERRKHPEQKQIFRRKISTDLTWFVIAEIVFVDDFLTEIFFSMSILQVLTMEGINHFYYN